MGNVRTSIYKIKKIKKLNSITIFDYLQVRVLKVEHQTAPTHRNVPLEGFVESRALNCS